MRKKIISIGFQIPGYGDCYHRYNSSQSLLDADIVIFEPDLSRSYIHSSTYQGKACFDEDISFLLREDTENWRSEILTALQDGKTVFVFMDQYKEIFVHTGKKEFSGTGKNTRTTDMVSLYNNYEFLPINIPRLVPSKGSEIIFCGNSLFTIFWNEFKEYINYECYMQEEISTPLFSTKTGKKPVGGLFREGKGNLVLLPPIGYSQEEFTEYNEEEDKIWTKEAIGFGNRLVQVLLDIDSALRSSTEASPPPSWTKENECKLKSETDLTKKISTISEKMGKLEEQKNTLSNTLEKEKKLKGLLFEKGKPLENAVIEALRILGYKAENYDDGNLELDQVIVGPDGERYVGETEGKDNGAINIEKFRQLESNIQEDLQREEVSNPAIGVLFGNGFRIVHPEKREEQFTEKCIKNAERVNAILVRTSDFFKVAKYIRESNDEEFAEKCREAISESRGKIVEFPEA